MSDFWHKLADALLMAVGMFWDVGWSLVLGFAISAILQACVSQNRMQAVMGRDDARAIALATLLGAASSSCSYASASIMRTMFKKGAALVTALAFLFSSTNLVIELGIILYLLMGWQFMAAEWIGGVVLVVIMTVLVRLTYPVKLVEEARRYKENGGMHEHMHGSESQTDARFLARLRDPQTRIAIAHNFTMDWSMLWKDLTAGFLIAGALSAFVPVHFWETLFLKNSTPLLQVPVNAVTGVIVAVLSFVCSIGNVPMAAVLWGSGISFGGVLAFLYADLVVLPLLDVYRRYFGWKMAAYIAAIFSTTMVVAALVMDGVFSALGLVPGARPDIRAEVMHFSINYTFWLNLIFGVLAVYLFVIARRQPIKQGDHECCEHGDHSHGA